MPRLASARQAGHSSFDSLRQAGNVSFDSLKEGQVVDGFRAEAVYLNDADKPFGARLRHARTGFTLDFLEIQSVPQVFAWVNSFPTSDRGEPHTQEHLLLGKGNVGRAPSGLEGMSLAVSTAFMQQWRTCYQFYTAAGPDVFYKLFESQMNALLHPDYTDEEIRREVSHWGVSENPADKSLRLEEKGTVYQEMRTSFDRPVSLLFRAENLARIRDVVDQILSGMRNRMQSAEENWVNDPANAYWRQDNPLLLSTSSFLTQAHNVHRLRWLLKDAGEGAQREAISSFLTSLADAGAKGKRDELKSLLAAMQGKRGAQVPAGLKSYADDYARILPGLGAKASEVRGGVFYVIGPEKQLTAYEQYLKTVEGQNAKLYRIYPRDYWMTLKEAEGSSRADGN